MDKQQMFRKQSMNTLSSPEQLNDYIRVSNPGVWLVLAAVIILLIGVCAWGVLGRMDTTVPAVALVQDGEMTAYLKEEHFGKLDVGMDIRMKDAVYVIDAVADMPILLAEDMDEYALHVGQMHVGEWVITAQADCPDMPNGIYGAEVVVESIAPMTFILN